jgi:aspartyl protease family protein
VRLNPVLLCLAAALTLTPFPAGAVENVSLLALFKDKAILTIDGTRRVLKAGDTSPEGVKLVSTDTQEERASVEIEGKPEVLRLGVVISGFTTTRRGSVILYPERGGHFFADGLINGVSVRFMVDTGATTIAMSSAAASRIGLDYRKLGRPGAASTASGFVRTYNLKLNTVQIGEITLHNVDAGVVEGNHPTEILLGMSFLGQLDMKRDSEKMELTHR